MKEAVIYARSATVGQAGKMGVQSQIKELRAYAKKHGYKITKEYVDSGENGSNLLRTGLTKLRKDVEQAKVKTILVTHPARLSRNVIDFTLLTDLFKKSKVTVEYTQIVNDDSAKTTLAQNILVAVSQLESEILSQRVKEAMKLKKSKETEKTHGLAAQGLLKATN